MEQEVLQPNLYPIYIRDGRKKRDAGKAANAFWGGIMEHNIVVLSIELNQSHFARRFAFELILDLFPEVVQETCPAVI